MSKAKSYKYCFVRGCPSTTINNPDKKFVSMPSDLQRRKVWLTAIRRDPTDLSMKSCKFICEDHFNLEEDIENYVKYKYYFNEKRLTLKPDAVPRILPYQGGGAGSFKCCDCNKEFKRENAYYNHVKFVCGKPPRFQCYFCPHKCRRKSDLKCHIGSVHSQDHFVCSECRRTFKDQSDLDFHVNDECGQMRFKCFCCDYKTRWDHQLKSHISTAHMETTATRDNYVCWNCHKPFYSEMHLNRHKYTCGKDGEFRCFHCSHKTKMKAHLRSHIMTNHLKMKNFLFKSLSTENGRNLRSLVKIEPEDSQSFDKNDRNMNPVVKIEWDDDQMSDKKLDAC